MCRSTLMLLTSFVLSLGACKGGAPASRSAGEVAGSVTGQDVASSGGVPTLPARPDPCQWVAADTVNIVIGPLAGSPKRGLHYDDPTPDAQGFACVYTLAPRPGDVPTGEPNTVTVELRLDDATAQEAGYRAGGALAAGLAKQLNGGKSFGVDTTALHRDGWDFQSEFGDQYLWRIGHLGVFIGVRAVPRIESSRLRRLAALVRDRVPDQPFASAQPQNESGDPCKFITRSEAEAVLGKLAYAPFRSTSDGPLVDPGGAGCSYYVGKHRVFTIKPDMEMGRQLFQVAAGAGQFFGSAAHLPNQSADTLEGTWDQAAEGPDGTLYFLKGDKMLTVVYRTSNVSIPDALKLVNIGLKRL